MANLSREGSMAGHADVADHVALVIGINEAAGREPLRAAFDDAAAMATMLEFDGGEDGDDEHPAKRRWQVTLLASKAESTTDRVQEEFERLVTETEGKHLLFYFSGHGDVSYGDLDLLTGDGSVAVDRMMKRFNACAARSVTVIFDCCYSGLAGEQPAIRSSGVETGLPGAVIRENLALLTASRREQEAEDGDDHSPFTRLLLAGLDGGAADPQGSVSIVDLFSYVSGYFLPGEQRPQLKINMTDEPFTLRQVRPRVPQEVLGKLTTWFPTVYASKQLTEAHEGQRPDWPPAPGEELTDLQTEFDEIGSVRNLGMIQSVVPDEPHYWVAKHSHSIKLSPVGQWYWLKLRKRQNAAPERLGADE